MMVPEGRVRSILVLQPREGDSAALVEFFKRRDVLGLAVREAGAWSAELHVPVAGGGPVVVTALWDSAEAYAGWRNHPVRATFNADMQRLVESEAPPIASGIYTVVMSAARSVGA
jgi:heme-degrading monooxygenase HmoA